MVQWMILSVGLITLVQCIDSSPGKKGHIFSTRNNINITYYCDFNYTKKEFKVSLIRGINKSDIVCTGSFNETHLPFENNNCTVMPTASNVTFHLWGLNENNTDIYFFRKDVMYPPPYTYEYDEGTIIHIKETLCEKQVTKEIQKSSLSLWVALGGFVLYSIIITTAFLYILRKGRRTRIQQSEYINVVPRRPKNHKSYAPYATTPVHSRTR
ncbi:T-cell-specific surface glycoprotein CD28 isoform X2 [Mixophyes fleayi]|uniref:T-cell-specific surface glycoprotein CD28 isoform X2 n=1 Tax=Mixophyes fleayi TaxID=3061075 RepID=UPI003F4DA827